MTKIASPTYRKEYLHNSIKGYQENVWNNEIAIFNSELEIAKKQKQIKEIEAMLEKKEYNAVGTRFELQSITNEAPH
jgi:hypothetical protein